MKRVHSVRYAKTGRVFKRVSRPPKRGEYRVRGDGTVEFAASDKRHAVEVRYVA